jgi:hypothetical protein
MHDAAAQADIDTDLHTEHAQPNLGFKPGLEP